MLKTFKFGHSETSLTIELEGETPQEALKSFKKSYEKDDFLHSFFAKRIKELQLI